MNIHFYISHGSDYPIVQRSQAAAIILDEDEL
jgi:hypothetical protein